MHEIGLKTRKARKYRGFGQKEKYLDPVKIKVLSGAPAGTRTPDTLLKRQVLYLLSYWGRLAGMAGLEPTISESKSGVLPLHYIPIWRRLVNEPGQAGLILCGVGYGARTHDTRNHNPVLYQLS